jgi:DNA-binding FadR family transcriptional regulator
MNPAKKPLSEFLTYLADMENNDGDRLPPLSDLSRELGISVTTIREQLEVARALGVVEVKPKTGIRRLEYSFLPSVMQSLKYALKTDKSHFRAYSDLRSHLEAAYWYEAVGRLTPDDIASLKTLVVQAQIKLKKNPPQLPQSEHRQLHLGIYKRLNNPFVTGLLEAYWDAYEEVGLDVYTDYQYLSMVWDYHQRMVDDIAAGELDKGYKLFLEHIQLLNQRTATPVKQVFE